MTHLRSHDAAVDADLELPDPPTGICCGNDLLAFGDEHEHRQIVLQPSLIVRRSSGALSE